MHKICDIISLMRRSLWFWLYFIFAIVLSVYFCVRAFMVLSGHGALSRVRNISISADSSDMDLSAVATAATLAPNTRAYSVNLDDINVRVGAVPGVRESAVRRLPNGNLIVRVSLYRAVALWTDGENYFPLSADGTIVNSPTQTRDASHVVFRGDVPENIADITKAAHNFIGRLDYLEFIEGRRWNVYTVDGITIMLPEENPVDAIGALVMLNNKHDILSKKITVIDMRDTARVLVK